MIDCALSIMLLYLIVSHVFIWTECPSQEDIKCYEYPSCDLQQGLFPSGVFLLVALRVFLKMYLVASEYDYSSESRILERHQYKDIANPFTVMVINDWTEATFNFTSLTHFHVYCTRCDGFSPMCPFGHTTKKHNYCAILRYVSNTVSYQGSDSSVSFCNQSPEKKILWSLFWKTSFPWSINWIKLERPSE